MVYRWRKLVTFLVKIRFIFLFLILLVVYNECVHYYIVLWQCNWPSLAYSKQDSVRVVAMADTHLLGSREGHWFDKLRREWQMEQAFQVSVWLNQPHAVFVLGDLFDEGKWCDDIEFQFHVERFRRKFRIPENTLLFAVAGNHDIGFHYAIDENKLRRFERAFNTSSVQLLEIKGNIFVLLTSMAFEGDGCQMCQEAESSLRRVIHDLDCARGALKKCSSTIATYSRPVLLQHFPLYRKSDSHCTGPDAADGADKRKQMVPRWGCLAKDISDKILDQLRPRLVVSGHTHHFCYTVHRDNIQEWTVPSFSWRNKNNPSFLLIAINNDSYAVEKCYLPNERTIVIIYVFGLIILLLSSCLHCCFKFHTARENHVD